MSIGDAFAISNWDAFTHRVARSNLTLPPGDKKVTFVVASGGMYDPGTQMASFNHVEPYLRSIFEFIGVSDLTFLTAGGTMALRQGKDRGEFLAPHIQAVQTQANSAR